MSSLSSFIYKSCHNRKLLFKNIFVPISVLITLLELPINSLLFNNQNICFSTAHSYFNKYKDIFNMSILEELSPEQISSLKSFNLASIIIQTFDNYNINQCYSLYILKFFAYIILPLLLSYLCAKFINFKPRKLILVSLIIIYFSRYIYILDYFLPLNILNFNYPILIPNIYNTIHINGLLNSSFSILLISTILLSKNMYFNTLIYVIAGLINPITSSLLLLTLNIVKMIISKEIILKNLSKTFIPIISFLAGRFIWNFFNIYNVNNIPQSEGLNIFDANQYLNFLFLNDVHRNKGGKALFNLFKSLFKINYTYPFEGYDLKYYLLILLTYLTYVLLFLFILFMINRYINTLNKYVMVKFDILSIYNTIFILLVSLINIDLVFKLFIVPLKLNFLNINVIYNQFYFSRLISHILHFTYFFTYFISSIGLINLFFIKTNQYLKIRS